MLAPLALLFLVACQPSELERCIEANVIDKPPTYTLNNLLDEANKSYGEYRTPKWKNDADLLIYECINNFKDNYSTLETYNYDYKIRARNCIQEEKEYRKAQLEYKKARAKASCHSQGIY